VFVLLPPSEGKSDAAGTGTFGKAQPDEVADTEGVLRHLKRLKVAERLKFYGIKDADKCGAAHKRNLAALEAGTLPAIQRYTGVVYQHLDYDGLRQKAYARKHLLVVSALFGLIEGGTGIPDYKLSMNPWLARYWKEENTARLAALTRGKPVVNLLSQTYAKAIDTPDALNVDFRVQGGKKSAGHFGKAIKGRFVRWLVENKVKEPADFAGFTDDGYRWNGTDFIQR
jgi:hypothetical protein